MNSQARASAPADRRRLEAEGYRPAEGGKRITSNTIRNLMRQLGCPLAESTAPHLTEKIQARMSRGSNTWPRSWT
ncbi:hypothetical protein [Streptomyces bicolor]|uniref:hypothetical protein n=1 Tax=Streptomyces bicolor TaxID=66874 RepID=UPI000A868F56|nr:hypothetical protein [Streptomyces bicolor]